MPPPPSVPPTPTNEPPEASRLPPVPPPLSLDGHATNRSSRDARPKRAQGILMAENRLTRCRCTQDETMVLALQGQPVPRSCGHPGGAEALADRTTLVPMAPAAARSLGHEAVAGKS